MDPVQKPSNPFADELLQAGKVSSPMATPAPTAATPQYGQNNPLFKAGAEEAKQEYVQKQPEQTQAPMAWMDVGKQAVTNFPSSAGKAAYGMVEPFLPSNWEQTGTALKGIGQGLYSKAQGALGYEQPAEEKARNEAVVNAIGDYYANRYGTKGGFQHALAEDPASVLMDLSVPLTGGESALARAPGLVGRVAGKGVLAAATNPIAAGVGLARGAGNVVSKIPVVGGIAQGVADVPSAAFEGLTGTSTKSLGDAFSAGREGGTLSGDKEFLGQMRGTAPQTDIVDRVRSAVDSLANKRSQDYLSGMSTLQNGTGADISAIRAASDKLLADTAHSPVNYPLAQKVSGMVDAFEQGQIGPAYSFTPGQHTLHELDLLKRAIRDVAKDPTTPGGKLALDVADAAKGAISKIDPNYSNIMEQYGSASDQLSDIARGLGNRNMTPEQQAQKILSARNKGQKQSLIDQLGEIDPSIPKMISGADLSRSPKFTVQDLLGGGALGYYGTTLAGAHPGYAALAIPPTMLLKSPRALGETAYYAGKGSELATMPGATLPGTLSQLEGDKSAPPQPSSNPFTRQFEEEMQKSYGAPKKPTVSDYFTAQDNAIKNKTTIDDEIRKMGLTPLPRASGGRTNNSALSKANQLIEMAEHIKKKQGKQTEPLLNLDDTTVAKALAVANQHI